MAAGTEYRSPRRTHDRQFFYKYMTANTAKIVLSTRKLRWSSPLLFNDPFDITQELRLNFDAAKLNAVLNDRWISLIEQGDPSNSVKNPMFAEALRMTLSLSPEMRQKIANDHRREPVTTTLGQIEATAELKNIWRRLVPLFRVMCLSEANDITPMWLNYADRYKGVVLEFSAVAQVDSIFLVAKPIVYQDAPPAIANPEAWVNCLLGEGEPMFQKIITEYQYVKTTPWSHEREWRIVVPLPRLGDSELFGDYGFFTREVTGIYFGPHCSAEDRSDLLALLSHGLEHVQAYEAFSDPQQAKFEFRPIQRSSTKQS
jgi:Protein of unknown function (DUF2971)